MHRILSASLLFASILASTLDAQQTAREPEPSRNLELKPVFDDDFSKDTRSDYQIEGDVDWEQGKLTLPEGASIKREIHGGSWAEIEVDFGEDGWPKEQDVAELQIWFYLEGATDCFVRIRKATNGFSVTLFDTREEDGQSVPQVIGEMWTKTGKTQELNVVYRNGLVSLIRNDSEVTTAYIENGSANVNTAALVANPGSCSLVRFQAARLPSPHPLTQEQQRLAVEAELANRQLFTLFQKGQIAKAIQMGERAIAIRKELFGENHLEYAASLHSLAFILTKSAKPARAEPLLAQVIEIRKNVLGEEHPKYAESLTSLAVVYYSKGEYAKAELLLKEARDIQRTVRGEKHADHLKSLGMLASFYRSIADFTKAEPLFLQLLNIQKTVLGEDHPEYVKTLDKLAGIYFSTIDYASAEPLFLKAIDIRKRVLGEAHPDYATSLCDVARLYFAKGDYARAEPLFLEALNIRKQVLGEEHADYASNLGDAATLYFAKGDYVQAEPLFLKAVELERKVLGEEHPEYATSINGLASLYYQKRNYARAESLFVQAQAIRKKVLGEEHPDYASSLNNLANLYESMGEFERAESLFLQALDIRKRVLGEEHPDYATSLNNLAALYESMSMFGRAEHLYLQACDIRRKVLGEDHPEYATSLNNLANLYSSIGNYDQSEAIHLQALALRKRVAGEVSVAHATSLTNLASLYKSMGEYARAEPLYLQACGIFRAVLGAGHPDYATSLSGLAGLYGSMGQYTRAELLHAQARDIRKNTLGEEHPDYARSLNNLAALYKSIGEFNRAESLYLRALDILKNVIGEEHSDYATTLDNLASLYSWMGEYSRAEPLFLHAQAIRKQVLGEEHPNYARSLDNLADLYKLKGEYARAESLYRQSHDIQLKVLGEEHPAYVTSLNSLAGVYFAIGEYKRAEPLYLQIRDTAKKVLGNEHPIYATSLSNLAEFYESKGEFARAEPFCSEAIDVNAFLTKQLVPVMSEAQARNWLDLHPPLADLVLSNLRRQRKWDSPKAYAAIWTTKGLLSRLQLGRQLTTGATPQAREVYDKLQNTRLRLARLISAEVPAPNQAESFQREVKDISERKEKLEKQLVEVSSASERQLAIRDASVEQLLGILPPRTAVVDLALLTDRQAVDAVYEHKQQDGTVQSRNVRRFRTSQVYDAFVLRSDNLGDIPWIQLGSAEPINQAINDWRSQLVGEKNVRGLETRPVRGEENNAASPDVLLRKQLWDKIEPHLAGCDTVIIIPDGDLTRLPWAALPGRDAGTYLIHDYAISTASYGQQLFGLLSDEAVIGDGLALAGGIDYDARSSIGNVEGNASTTELLAQRRSSAERGNEDSSWGFLQGAEIEAETIQSLWNDRGEIDYLTDETAGETQVATALSESRYAHLATHGFFSAPGTKSIFDIDLREQSLFESETESQRKSASVGARNPLLLSGIVLSGANVPADTDDLGLPIGDDGILTAEEIVGLELRNLELITLSACETGLGEVAAGEGVFGLQRAFHQAGARAVVASLWKVSDNATQALMVEFYQNLWDKKMSKAEALRQAQLTMLERYDPSEGQLRGLGDKPIRHKSDGANDEPSVKRLSPLYWAAFQLSGDWR